MIHWSLLIKKEKKGKSLEYQILHFCLPLNDEAGGAVIEVWMTDDDVEFGCCSLFASTLDGLGRPGMAEELVLQKPPPFFAAEFDILSWYSIILWKLSQTCHFSSRSRQKQVQHSPTLWMHFSFIGPLSDCKKKNRSSYLLFMIDWWWQQQLFVYISFFLTVTIWRDFSMPFTFWLVQRYVFPRFSSDFVFLQFFSPFDVLSFARSVLGERTMLPDQSFQTSAKKCSKTP